MLDRNSSRPPSGSGNETRTQRARLAFLAAPAATLAIALTALVPGCSKHLAGALVPNQPPQVEILDARADRTNPSDVIVKWAARDPDGTVARCLWTLTPTNVITSAATAQATAQATAGTAREAVLARRTPVGRFAAGATRPIPEIFSLWAVDDQGAQSPPVKIGIIGNNVAPTVYVTCPLPSPLSTATVGPDMSVSWTGVDPDGITTQHPVSYKYILLPKGGEFDINYAVTPGGGDSLRNYFAARNWAGWTTVPGDTTYASFTGLTLGQQYLFVITAFDEMGDYDPVFATTKNMVSLQVTLPQNLGPRLAMFNSEFNYSYPIGGFSTDPSRSVTVEEPADRPLTFNYLADPGPNDLLLGYRWALDMVDPTNPTVRSNPNDLAHWSAWSMNTAVTVGPFSPVGTKRESHTLYIEAGSSGGACAPASGPGALTLGMVHFIVVRPSLNSELLIVDDTRSEVDQFVNGQRKPYGLNWPARAELDTFLFARGGVPWRGTVNPASGVNSTPGVFAGYAFDTLGTRGVRSGPIVDYLPSGTIPLSTLAEYRHVIWMVDHYSGYYSANITSAVQPISALHYMSTPGHENALAEYIAMGGKVWVMGGTTAISTLREYNAIGAANNDRDYAPINGYVFAGDGYAHFAGKEELVPGRLMYDRPAWRSLVMCQAVAARLVRSPSATASAPWTNQPGWNFSSPVHRPDYSLLPASLHVHTNPASDPVNGEPVPPTRPASYASTWWSPSLSVDLEYLIQPNNIFENMDADPNNTNLQVALDTLYSAQGSGLVMGGTGYEPASMTWYHGVQSPEFVFTGFPIWSWRRSDCQQLVDFVLQQIWHLPKTTLSAGPGKAPYTIPYGRTPSASPTAVRTAPPAWRTSRK